MDGFKEGYEFFESHAGEFAGLTMGDTYVGTVNNEIESLLDSINAFKGSGARVDTLKGDVAEFWHAHTFNVNAAVNGSGHRMQVDRSHDFGSVDVSGENFDASYGLKYYKDGIESAKQQAKSYFERFKEYQAAGGKDGLDKFLADRNISGDTLLSDPIYTGQQRLIPSDQLEQARKWLEDKIAKESTIRPEQVKRYEETLKLLTDRVKDNQGNESIVLSEEDARKLAQLAKEGNATAEELNLTTEELIHFENIMKQSFKAGLTAATITLVLKTAPEIYKALDYLIRNGEVDEEQFKKVGFAAVSGASEGFIRGSVSAAITASCKSGLLGEALKSVDPTVVGMVTVLVMDTMKNSYKVATGKMSRYEMTNELIKTMFTSSCALASGALVQTLFVEAPGLGFMLGSFVGSVVGSFAYSAAYKPAISFCAETGFTMFGLVNQDYELPDDVIKEIGLEVFDYDQFEYKQFEPVSFEYKEFIPDSFEPATIGTTFLRRGVIGISEVGYITE